ALSSSRERSDRRIRANTLHAFADVSLRSNMTAKAHLPAVIPEGAKRPKDLQGKKKTPKQKGAKQ
ncbi:MAG: hypothetical protein IIX09_04110, partial [Clostridia bacterium]|nr:hypothetical protein [Clostridia bacterium]